MSTNDRETEELLLKGLATGHVWKVYRNKGLYRNKGFSPSSYARFYSEGRRATWRKCIRCGEVTDAFWSKANARYYQEFFPCSKTTTKR